MGEARVIDSRKIASDVDAVVAGGGQGVVDRLARFSIAAIEVEEVDFFLVGAALTDAVGEQCGVVRDIDDRDGGVGVAGEGSGVDEAEMSLPGSFAGWD